MMLALFVYGTLLRGESNHSLLRGAAEKFAVATLGGAQLFDLGPYPMALETALSQNQIQVELIWMFENQCSRILRRLDVLEGVRSEAPTSRQTLFRREIRTAFCQSTKSEQTNGKAMPISCWVYFGRDDLARRGRLVSHGDWRSRFSPERFTHNLAKTAPGTSG